MAEDNPQLKPPAIAGGPAAEPNRNDREFRELIIGARATRQTELRNTQEALYFLAWQTGGFALLDTNDLAGGFRRVVDDLQGYYLLGYEVPDDAPRNWDPGRISVRVLRPG